MPTETTQPNNQHGSLEQAKNWLPPRSFQKLEGAKNHSNQIIEKSKRFIEDYAKLNKVSLDELCFVAVGSVGRKESLEASDLDLIPIGRSFEAINAYRTHDQNIRQSLRDKLGIKVSRGEELTSPVDLNSLSDASLIGNPKDNSEALTKRILVLTEGAFVAGMMTINDVRAGILKAYSGEERSSGRHTLSLCNDIARYYRTLCIEYKNKVDVDKKEEWCIRNLKLRHSRKLWYFSNILMIVHLAKSSMMSPTFEKDLLLGFDKTPIERILSYGQEASARMLECYATFLSCMAEKETREKLNETKYDERYQLHSDNKFPFLKLNSDLLHSEIMNLTLSQEPIIRNKIFDWFLF
jgi:hypothetical protein